MILGLSMSSRGWQDLTNLRPAAGERGRRGSRGFGYHMHDGMKCIVGKSAFCGAHPGHTVHHIKENHQASGYVFTQAFVLVPKLPMVIRFRGDDHGTLGDDAHRGRLVRRHVLPRQEQVLADAAQEHCQMLLKQYEVPADAPAIRIH